MSNAAELRRPVEAFSGEELDPVSLDTGLQAIAVELDLMDPFGALRRRVGQGREAGLEKSRQDALLRAPELRQLARTCGLSPGSLASRVIGPQVAGLRQVGVRASGQDRCRDLLP